MQKPTLEQRLAVRTRQQKQPLLLQKWRDLLFLHWSYEPEKIQSLLPMGLYVDTFNNAAYLGLVPFFMCDIKPYFCGKILPGLNFPELNLRTYVYNEAGVPGVYFFSLYAGNKFAASFGRQIFHLPYQYARFQTSKDSKNLDNQSDTVFSTRIFYIILSWFT
jgi:uncharacterized protein YqjF (DUF2071 family)